MLLRWFRVHRRFRHQVLPTPVRSYIHNVWRTNGSLLQNIHPADPYTQRFRDQFSCGIHPEFHPAGGNPCLPPRAEADHLFPSFSFRNHISGSPFHVCRLLHQNCIFPSYALLLVAKFSRFLYLFLLDMSMFFL